MIVDGICRASERFRVGSCEGLRFGVLGDGRISSVIGDSRPERVTQFKPGGLWRVLGLQ